MDRGERDAFDTLIQNAGADNVSRAKGRPTVIAHNRLPGPLQAAVTTVYNDIKTQHQSWNIAMFTPYHVGENYLREKVSNNFHYYQGNHTNKAGWLPNVVVPANPAKALFDAIYNNAGTSRSVRGKMLKHNFPYNLQTSAAKDKNNYEASYNAEFGGFNYNDGDARKMAWTALGYDVSAYIEFSLPADAEGISRLVFDFVNKHYYLTAHYKWRGGYNPFFKVTGLAAI